MCNLAFHSKEKTIMPLLMGLVVAIKLLIAQSNAGCKRAKPKPSPGKPLWSPLDFLFQKGLLFCTARQPCGARIDSCSQLWDRMKCSPGSAS